MHSWHDRHPRVLDALFVFDVVCIVVTICAFGALLSWLSGA